MRDHLGLAIYLGSLVNTELILQATVYFYGCLLDKSGAMAGEQVKLLIDRMTQ